MSAQTPFPELVTSDYQMLDIDLLEPNEGQLEGLPANPRDILSHKFELLKENIVKYPQFLRYNQLKVFPLANGHYIVIGGNMRYRALLELGYKVVPCAVIDPATDIEDLKAYTILDNNGFGRWDWDMLANEWDEDLIRDWGVDINFEIGADLFGDPESDVLCDKKDTGYFSVLFAIKSDYEDAVKGYIKVNGKDSIIDKIIELCQSAEAK